MTNKLHCPFLWGGIGKWELLVFSQWVAPI